MAEHKNSHCQPSLEEAQKISEEIVAQFEKNNRVPSLNTFMALAVVLGWNFKELVERGEANPISLQLFVMNNLGVPVVEMLQKINSPPIPPNSNDKNNKNIN